MDFTIPGEYERLRAAFRQFIEREVEPAVKEAPRNEFGELPDEMMHHFARRSAELGFWQIELPEEYGGISLNVFGAALLVEEEGRHFPNHGVGPHMLGGSPNGPHKTWLKGTEAQIQKYLWPLVRAEKFTAFALTEPGAGSDNQAMTTTAVKQGDKWVINGIKHFISGAHMANFIRVFAVTDKAKKARGGITCFILETDTPGFKIARRQKTMGTGMAPCELHFDDCAVPEENIFGDFGRGLYLGLEFLNQGRLNHAAKSCGTAETALKMSVSYSKQRVTFGQPLAERQAIQWMLADSATELEATRWLTYMACWKADQGIDVRAEAAMAKLYGTEMVARVVDRAIQIHGGIGYTTDLPLEGFYRNIRSMRIGEGASEIMRILIARQLLKD